MLDPLSQPLVRVVGEQIGRCSPTSIVIMKWTSG